MRSLVLLLLIIISMVTVVHGFRAYDCFHDRSNMTAISLIDVGECPILQEEKVTVQEISSQVIQDKNWHMLHVFHCSISVTKLISHCGMHSHSFLVQQGLQSYLLDIDKDECMDLINKGSITLEGYQFTDLKGNTTSEHHVTLHGTIDRDGTCHGSSFSTPRDTYENVVVQATITIGLKDYYTLMETGSGSVTFNDGTICKVEHQQCIHPLYGSTFWTINQDHECSRDSADVIFEGPLTYTYLGDDIDINTMASVKQGESLFSLRITGRGYLCHQQTFTTDHPRIHIILRKSFGFFFTRRAILPQNMDLIMYMNSKLTFVTHHIEIEIKKLYNNLLHKNCMIEQQTIKNKLSIVKNHPIAFGNLLTNEEGYMNILGGEVIYMLKCQPVDVKLVKLDYCTSHLPVMYLNSTVYMEPISKVLTNVSLEIPCSMMSPQTYKLGGEWYSFSPHVAKTSSPSVLSPKTSTFDYKFDNIKNLFSSGLYDHDAMDKFRNFMSFPLIKMETNNYISAKLTGGSVMNHGQYNTEYLIDKEYIQRESKQLLVGMLGWIATFGTYAGALWGFFVIYKIASKVISIIFNGLTIHDIHGCGVHLVGSLLNSLTQFIIYRSHTKEKTTETIPTKDRDENIMIDEVKEGSHNREDSIGMYPLLSSPRTYSNSPRPPV